MSRNPILIITIILAAQLLAALPAYAQQINDPEAEYARIRALALDGKSDSAAAAARVLVNAFPDYGDARILLGRILAWDKQYPLAAAVIDTLLATDPENADALSLKRDIIQWAKENQTEATGIRAGYLFDTFREPYKRFWQVFSAGAEHRFGWGLAAADLNVGSATIGEPNPDNATEWQIAAEAYPKFSAKNYAYLAYAYSPGNYFPTHRAAAELWQVLPAGWAASAGMNYYYFNRNIYIALASVEKYSGRYWFSLKGYLYFKDKGVTTSGYLNIRRYYTDINYLQLTLGAGTAPDEPFDIQTDLMRYSAYSTRITWYRLIVPRLAMRIGAGYSYEEYENNVWRNRFEGNVNFTYAIRMK